MAGVEALKKNYRAIAAWLLCASFLAGAMRVFGHRQMGAFDDNIIIDTAWRMFIGQKPYLDFYLPLSPEFYLGAGWAFRLWGVNWSALVLISTILAVLTFALQSVALGHFLPRRYAISLSLACQMLAMMVTSYWWYNSNAAITACLLFSVALALVTSPASKTLAIIFCIALMMLGVMKVNIAAVSILAVLISLLTVRELRTKTIVWIGCSALAGVLVLIACQVSPVDLVKAYLKMAGSRGMPSPRNFFRGKPNEVFVSLPLLGACLGAFAIACRQIWRVPRDRRPARLGAMVVLASSGVSVGLFCIFTSTEQNLISGLPLILVSSSSLIIWALEARMIDIKAPVALTIALVMCACATVTGLALFERLPFAFLVGRGGLRLRYMALLMAWSFFAVMSAAAFLAGLADIRPARFIERFRPWALLPIVAVVAGASVAFGVTARALPALTPHVMVPYVALLLLWSIVAVAGAIGVGAVIVRASPWLEGSADRLERWSVVLAIVLATSAAAALFVSATRLRVRGNGAFYSREPTVAVDLPFFRGFSVSPGLKATVEQIQEVLRQHDARGASQTVFFGTRLEFAYAAFGIPSPTQLPVWWDPAAAYPPADEPQIVERFIAHRFPLCVFYGREPDFAFMPDGIAEELTRNYRKVAYSEITVFVRNPEP